MSNVMLYIVLGAILAPSNLCAPHGSTSREQAAASKIGQEGTTVDDGTVNRPNEEEDEKPSDSAPATKSDLSIEAEGELKLFGIEDAHPNIKLFAKNQIKQAKKKDETISNKDNKIGELQKDKVNLENEYKRMAVLYFFRIRLDYLQWTLAEDEDVKKVMKSQEIDAPTVPADIPEDGKNSYIGRYKIWLAIYKVLCSRQEMGSKEERDYVREFANKLKSVGLRPNPGSEEKHAATVAQLIVNLSNYSKQDLTKIKWKNEEEVMRALSEWHNIEGDQQKVARAVYRLKIM